jgi:Ca2+-binding RTX toxin-like protein
MAYIAGTDDRDILMGTTEADTIDAYGGIDSIAAGAGNDYIYRF